MVQWHPLEWSLQKLQAMLNVDEYILSAVFFQWELFGMLTP